MALVALALAIVFTILGVVLLKGKGEKLIAVYRLMPKAKKDKIDKKDFCRFNGKVSLAMALCCVLLILGDILEFLGLAYLGISIIVVLAIGSTIYVLSASRFNSK